VAPLFIQSLMVDSARLNTFAGLVVGVSALTTTGSAVYLGRLGDRVGHRRIMLACTFLAALFYLPQSLVTSGWQLLGLQALVGVALGGVGPILSSLLATYTEPGEAGAAYGLDNSVNAGSRAVAPMLGAAVAVTFGLRATFVATGLLFLAATVIAMRLLPRPRRLMPLPAVAPLDDAR
jgi:DHA1 family multidrug resistance protein-like MFS transporter